MIEELTRIRDNILIGLEKKDSLYIKMQVNNIDTLIHELANKHESKTSNES